MTTTIRGTDNSAAAPALTGTDSDTGVYFPASDVIALSAGGAEKLRAGATEVVVNDTGANLDFRVEGDTDANLLFVDASADAVFVGAASSIATIGGKVQVSGTSTITSSRTTANAFGSDINFAKSRGGTDIVSSGDNLGNLIWWGANGTGYNTAAAIKAEVDGTPGASNDMPGRLVFSTTPDGSGTLTERMRVTSDGYLRMASGSGGIQFGGDTAAANALDDYEEGTWTPSLLNGGTPSYTTQLGLYTKIGRFVICTFQLVYTGASNAANTRLAGLPFATADSVLNRTGFAGPISTLSTKMIISTGLSTTVAYVDDLTTSGSFNGLGTVLLVV